jgi:hypothetical protein
MKKYGISRHQECLTLSHETGYSTFGKKSLIGEELKESPQNFSRLSWKKRGEK